MASIKQTQEALTVQNNERRLGESVLGGGDSRKSNWRVSLGLGLESWQERLNFILLCITEPWGSDASFKLKGEHNKDSRADGGAGNLWSFQ